MRSRRSGDQSTGHGQVRWFEGLACVPQRDDAYQHRRDNARIGVAELGIRVSRCMATNHGASVLRRGVAFVTLIAFVGSLVAPVTARAQGAPENVAEAAPVPATAVPNAAAQGAASASTTTPVAAT